MAIAWGTDSNLDDELFYNRKEDLEFLTNILDSSQYGSTPTILLTGIRSVGKTALMNKLKRDFNIIVQEFSGFFKPEMNCTLRAFEYFFRFYLKYYFSNALG